MKFLDKINSPEAREVFRKNKITATGLEAVRQGHKAKGDKFMYDFLKAISPKRSVLNGNFNDYLKVDTVDDADLNASIDYDLGLTETDKPKRTWDEWLVMLGKTGETLAGIKNNLTGSGNLTDTNSSVDGAVPSKTKSILIYAAAAIIVLVIGFFIYKQSK